MAHLKPENRPQKLSHMPYMVDEVAEAFRAQWQCQPGAVARAPGRVNLIGEHIDYEGYGVLPMAIDQACCVAVGWHPSAGGADTTAADALNSIHIGNVQPERYASAVLPLQPGADLPADTPSWVKYILAAYKGVVEFASSKEQAVPQHSDILLMVGSSVPPAAGLSSSSALVVAAALALLELWGVTATPNEVAEFTCKCERFVGTQGGGMDQAVSALAEAARAVHVEFNPVRAHPVPLPPGAMFVVANSLAPSAKAETASYRFNLRVLECRLAAMLLAHLLSCNSAGQAPVSQDLDWRQVSILKQVEVPLLQYAADNSISGSVTGAGPADALAGAVARLLPQSSYTLEQVSHLLNITQQQLLQLLPQRLQEAAAAATQLHLQQRAQHVFTEAHRVLTFRHVCEDTQLPADAKLQQLGELLNASHASCSQLYQCSCEELDTLVGVARAAGALGARLTGAGWGGCIVALVPQGKVSAFKKQLIQQYYQPLLAKGVITEQDLLLCVFASPPSAGATVKQIGKTTAAAMSTKAAVANEPVYAGAT